MKKKIIKPKPLIKLSFFYKILYHYCNCTKEIENIYKKILTNTKCSIQQYTRTNKFKFTFA